MSGMIGSILLLLAILHAVLINLFGLKFLKFGLDKYSSVGKIDFFIGLIGLVLAVIGYFLARTEEEEEEASIRRSERAMISQQRQQEQEAFRDASIPRCPNCGAKAPGNFLSGNRIIHCLTCGGVFCDECIKRLFLEKACPHCGETSQKNIKFEDTGTNW